MIISHRHRFIFLAIPKTGTHAIRFALRQHLDAADEEQVALFVHKALPYPDIAAIRHGHISALEIRAVLPPEMWDGYYKFAFVRNPWARFVSFCAFMFRNTTAFSDNPRATMERALANPALRQRVHFRAQHEFICDADGRLMVDYVGRQENMQASYGAICAHIGLPETELGLINGSTHGPWRDYFDASLRERVGELYARDIELFGYRFED